MLKINKYNEVFVILLSFLTFFINSCGNANQTQQSVQIKNETQEPKSLIIPQYELIETPIYKRLKQIVEKIQIEVNIIETQRIQLLTKYTEKHPSVKKITKDLEDAKKRLVLFELQLNAEKKELERQYKNPPV